MGRTLKDVIVAIGLESQKEFNLRYPSVSIVSGNTETMIELIEVYEDGFLGQIAGSNLTIVYPYLPFRKVQEQQAKQYHMKLDTHITDKDIN